MKHEYDSIRDESQPSLKEIGRWTLELHQLHERIAPRFARPEPRRRALLYLQAILSETPRKNSWQIAEHAKQGQPYGMQRFLSSAVWDCDGVRDDLGAYVLEQLGSADGIGIRLDLVKPGEIKVDGIPREWPSAMTELGKSIVGSSGPNMGMRGAIAYDDSTL